MPFLGTQPAETALTTGDLGADIVTGAKIADDQIDSEHYVAASIDNEHLADDAVGVAELSATGTASSSTFLRGDNAWAAPAGGSRKVLAVSTASGSSSAINFTAFNNSAYDSYEFIVHYWKPSGDGIECWVRTSTDGGSSYDSGGSDYGFHNRRVNSSGVGGNHADSSENEIVILENGSSGGAAAGEALHFRLFLFSAGDSTYQKGITWEGITSDASSVHMPFWGAALRFATTDIDALQFLGASGTWSAKITMIGINNSV